MNYIHQENLPLNFNRLNIPIQTAANGRLGQAAARRAATERSADRESAPDFHSRKKRKKGPAILVFAPQYGLNGRIGPNAA